MRSVGAMVWLLVFGVSALGNAQGTSVGGPATGRTALTIYNPDFAVIRTPVELNPQSGTTDNFGTHVEPDGTVHDDTASPLTNSFSLQSLFTAKFWEHATVDYIHGKVCNCVLSRH